MKYDYILNEYPATITKDQVYRILHISKRKAKWLLDSGYIKCKNSGKKTRKYTIKTKDLVNFLQDSELHPEMYPIPKGYFNSGYLAPKKSIVFTDAMQEQFRKLLEEKWNDQPDVLTVKQISKLLGYSKNYISKSYYRWKDKTYSKS